jgi:hypothetical protein
LAGSNIDVFKHSHKLADISHNQGMKKKNLLEEILKMGHSSGGPGRPIIVVPASYYPGNLYLMNAVPLLEQNSYMAPKEAEEKDQDKFQNKKTFTRKIGGEPVTFEVYDSVYGLTKKDWRRVVCMFTIGEYFQLKDWPPKEDEMALNEQEQQQKIVKIFHRIKGFYLHY